MVAQTLMLYLKSSKNPDECWGKQLAEFIKKCWPQKMDLNTGSISISFAQIILTLNNNQNLAFKALKQYFASINDSDATELFYLFQNPNNDEKLIEILELIIDKNNLTAVIKTNLSLVLSKIHGNDKRIEPCPRLPILFSRNFIILMNIFKY